MAIRSKIARASVVVRAELRHLLLVIRRTSVSSIRPWRSHCQICEREISAVAASSIRLLIATAPEPCSQAARYWIPTETLLRRPSSVTSPGVAATSSSAAARGLDVVALPLDLVRPLAEDAVERLQRDRNEVGVRDPGAVEALRRLALLVLPHLLERDRVHLGVAARRDEGRHAAHRVRAAAVARLDEELAVRAHERHRHRHGGAVGEHELGPVPELLDHAEDVVPAAGVEPGRVLAQLVEDLVHLERGEDRLDQDGRLDRPLRDAEPLLREGEDVVPEPRLEVRLELREVEVPPVARRGCGGSRGRSRTASRTSAAPSTSKWRSSRCQPRGRTNSTATSSFSAYCFSPVSSEIVRSSASVRFRWPSMQFSQVGEFASSKSAMKTFAPELSALITILRSTGPVISTRRSAISSGNGAIRQSPARTSAGLGEEVGQLARGEPCQPLRAAREELAAPVAELALEVGQERDRLRREDVVDVHRTRSLSARGPA